MKLVGTIDSVLRQKGRQVWSVSSTVTVYEAIEKMAELSVGPCSLCPRAGSLASFPSGTMRGRNPQRSIIEANASTRDYGN